MLRSYSALCRAQLFRQLPHTEACIALGLRRCCVQRIAKRSKVLAEERVALLDAAGFDWTGADALS